MNVKTIVALLAVFCLFSCAPLGGGSKFEGNTFSCEYPRFSVQFKKEVAEVREASKDGKIFLFQGGDVRPMAVQLLRVPHSSKIDYFYSLREIASNMNFFYLGDVRFGEKEWAKIAKFDEQKGMLYCGYFTNKDNEFIFIAVGTTIFSNSDKDALGTYKKTMIMPTEGLAIIDAQFEYFDQVAEIL